ncbi:MAG: DUF2065 domain-containing protein [Pseudomonadota bacterium]
MDVLWVALGLLLFIESVLYALFPNAMRRFIALVVTTPENQLRTSGMIAAALGFLLIWLVQG